MPAIALHDKAWSPYVAGIVIGLLQIPAFLVIENGAWRLVVLCHDRKGDFDA
jgi:hypothetical protein